jgi:epoxyqueuosine reductase
VFDTLDTVSTVSNADLATLKTHIFEKAAALGFGQLGVADVDLTAASASLLEWLAAGKHGEMHYMQVHGEKRWKPELLVPGTLRVISARMDYLPESQAAMWHQLNDPNGAYISRYALGRDYHKVLRRKLQTLADQTAALIGPFGYRVFVDSGPVLEKPLAQNAGLGWIGKHTNLINRDAGSWFFLGELLVDIALPIDAAEISHCGTCSRCIPACPTGAITAPYQLDARLCISYLTIEHKGSIPEPLRPLLGNRIYGCDDCQLVCPWNKFAKLAVEPDFQARHGLSTPTLRALFTWTEEEFLQKTEGSAIRRIGFERWQRNIAVALGNAPASAENIVALHAKSDSNSALVREHVNWAIAIQERQLQAIACKALLSHQNGNAAP